MCFEEDICSKGSVDLLHDEALDHIADLDVVELLHLHAAFIAGGDFLHVVLEAAQRGKLPLVDDNVVAEDPPFMAASISLMQS